MDEVDEVVALLSAGEREAFWRDGFIGPFPLETPAPVIAELSERLAGVVTGRQRSPLYGRYSQRDWHLLDPALEALMTQDAIVGRVASILGPDLLLWRSKIFHKAPGDGAIGWHQEWGDFDGEEIGNSVPALSPATRDAGIWDVTVWIALDEVTEENGPLQFAPGSHTTRVPWRKVPMTQAAFFEEPFHGLDAAEIARRTRAGELMLDVESSTWLDDYAGSVDSAGREGLISHLMDHFNRLGAKFTDYQPQHVVSMTMPTGHFVVFSERTMHGSLDNHSGSRRNAVNCRITRSDTLVYPGRLTGEYIDGSNLDVRDHECLLVSGRLLDERNATRSTRPRVRTEI
jgi:non-heme Fe2+,alpha-ketoglutarate-dependent halogenase